MATTFITGIALRPGRTPYKTACDSISYIENPKKTRGGELVTSFRCAPESAAVEIIHAQNLYEQKTGREVIQEYKGKKKSYLLMTMRQSFAPGEVTPEQAHRIGCELAERFLKGKYQYVVATHIDKAHIHNHIIFNIVGSDGKKFHQTKYTPRHLRDLSDKLCRENHLSVVIPAEYQERRYTNEKMTSYRTIIKNDIEKNIRAARDYEDFLNRMRGLYYVTDTGSVLKFRHRTNGQQRPIRSYTLGKGYGRPELYARAESGEELLDPVTISQKIRNIEAMFHAIGFIRENGADFEGQVSRLQKEVEKTQLLLKGMEDKIKAAQSICTCFDILGQPGHGEVYEAALATLRKNHVDADGEARDKFRAELSQAKGQAAELEKQMRGIREKIAQTQEAQGISERVQEDDPIIALKKGGRQYGR